MFKRMSRRAVIRGAGGVVIGLPFLEAMRPGRARAADASPKRFISWFSGNGQMPVYWYPTGTETNFTLNAAHKPLEPYQSKLILFDGVKNDAGKDPVYGGHQGAHASAITGVPFVNPKSFGTMRPGGPSLDQLIADKIGGATKIKSVQTGVNPGHDGGDPLQVVSSWRSATELLPQMGKPSELFDYLFMDGAPAGTPQNPMTADNLRKRRKSILDMAAGRFTTLRARVGTDDKARLDSHLTSIREVEKQVLAMQPQVACTVPNRPADTFDSLAGNSFTPLTGSNLPAWAKVNMDMMVLALACDLTRVASWMWVAMGTGPVTFSWLGHTNTHHNFAHGNAVKPLTEINAWFSTQLAYVMDSLDKHPDVAGGTMLDNTLILWWNELGNGSAHTVNPAPYVLAGGAGGALKMGRFLDYTAAPIQNTQLLLTVYNVMTGSQAKDLGPTSVKYCPGPAPGL
ncbi:MAG TPA: DUF1552 domain-containing protein [Polyangia bacterium]|jgi:hypothetical protein|nr:DUF1552 domain-containing protein [Polyangia bacterium]